MESIFSVRISGVVWIIARLLLKALADDVGDLVEDVEDSVEDVENQVEDIEDPLEDTEVQSEGAEAVVAS